MVLMSLGVRLSVVGCRLLRWLVDAAGVSEEEARATAQQVRPTAFRHLDGWTLCQPVTSLTACDPLPPLDLLWTRS